MTLEIEQNKTDDLITVGAYSKHFICSKLLQGSFWFIVGWILLNAFINIQPNGAMLFFLKLFSGVGGFFVILLALHMIVVSESVIIDKKSQNIIIKKNYIAKILKTTKKIPFSGLKYVHLRVPESRHHVYFFENFWEVKLITFNDEIVRVYSSYSQEDAEKVAHRILEIINRKDIYVRIFLPPKYPIDT